MDEKPHPLLDPELHREAKRSLSELVDGFFDPYEMMAKEYPEAKLAADLGPTRAVTSGIDFANYLLKKAGIRHDNEEDALGFLNAVGMFKTAPGMMLGKEAAKAGVSPLELMSQRLGMIDRAGDAGGYGEARMLEPVRAATQEFSEAWNEKDEPIEDR